MFQRRPLFYTWILGALVLLGITAGASSPAIASNEKVCRLNDFANDKCGEEPAWVQYCSIRVLCFEARSKEGGLITAKHQDGHVVKYKVSGWEEGIDWHNQRFSLLTFVAADGISNEIGKLWLRYDPVTQQTIESLLAYTPDGYDFQGVRAVNE